MEDRLDSARKVLEAAAEGGGPETVLVQADSLEAGLEEVEGALDDADFGLPVEDKAGGRS